jgi:hypothetical protein
MQGSEVPRAVAVARSTASSLGLTVDEAIVLHDSNDRESANRDLSRLKDHLSACLDDGLNGLRHRPHQPIHGIYEVRTKD